MPLVYTVYCLPLPLLQAKLCSPGCLMSLLSCARSGRRRTWWPQTQVRLVGLQPVRVGCCGYLQGVFAGRCVWLWLTAVWGSQQLNCVNFPVCACLPACADWPALYDEQRLQENTVPVAAASYYDVRPRTVPPELHTLRWPAHERLCAVCACAVRLAC